MEDWLALEIYDVNNDLRIELQVSVSNIELESAR